MTKISDLTDGSAAAATDRIAIARSPFASGDDRYLTPLQLLTYIAANMGSGAPLVLDTDTSTFRMRYSGSGENIFDIVLNDLDADTPSKWSRIVHSSANDVGSNVGNAVTDQTNMIVQEGYNMSAGGVRIDGTQPGYGWNWETLFFQPDEQSESYMLFTDLANVQHRPIFFSMPWVDAQNSVGYVSVDTFNFLDWDGNQHLKVDLTTATKRLEFKGAAWQIRYEQNGAPFLFQRNAADDGDLSLPYYDNEDRLRIPAADGAVQIGDAPTTGTYPNIFNVVQCTSLSANGTIQQFLGPAVTGSYTGFEVQGSATGELIDTTYNTASGGQAVKNIQSLTGDSLLRLFNIAESAWEVGADRSDTNALVIGTAVGMTTPQMTITSGGNVHINGRNGTEKLQVSGNIRLSGNIELGHASDTTLARSSAGDVSVEGNIIYRAGGADVPVADGGTGASTASDARANLGLVIGTNVQAHSANLSDNLGKHTIWVPAVAMSATTTSGAASGSAAIATSLLQAETFNFDGAAEEFVQFAVYMPKSWDVGTLTAQFLGSQTGASTNFGVTWGIEAVCIADDELMTGVSWGTEVITTDTYGTTDDLFISAESAAITVGSTPAAEQLVHFRVTRVVGDAGDTMTTADARLHGVRIIYTIDAGRDN